MGVLGFEMIQVAVGSLGFPIVAYFLHVTQTNKTITLLTEAVNNNTLAVKELSKEREG